MLQILSSTYNPSTRLIPWDQRQDKLWALLGMAQKLFKKCLRSFRKLWSPRFHFCQQETVSYTQRENPERLKGTGDYEIAWIVKESRNILQRKLQISINIWVTYDKWYQFTQITIWIQFIWYATLETSHYGDETVLQQAAYGLVLNRKVEECSTVPQQANPHCVGVSVLYHWVSPSYCNMHTICSFENR